MFLFVFFNSTPLITSKTVPFSCCFLSYDCRTAFLTVMLDFFFLSFLTCLQKTTQETCYMRVMVVMVVVVVGGRGGFVVCGRLQRSRKSVSISGLCFRSLKHGSLGSGVRLVQVIKVHVLGIKRNRCEVKAIICHTYCEVSSEIPPLHLTPSNQDTAE